MIFFSINILHIFAYFLYFIIKNISLNNCFIFILDKYNNENDSNSPSPKATERIIIGHEKSQSHADRRSEISAQLAKKYEGKSREVSH